MKPVLLVVDEDGPSLAVISGLLGNRFGGVQYVHEYLSGR